MENEEIATNAVIAHIEPGTSIFTIQPKDSTGACHGIASAALTHTSSQYTLELSAWLKLKLQNTTFFQDIKGTLTFNPLGQLGSSVFITEINGQTLRFGTLNINPMTITANIGTNPARTLFTQNIPGPIELRRVGPVYRMVGPPITRVLPTSGIASSLLKRVPFTVVSGNDTHCSRKRAEALDITQLPAQIQLMRGMLESTISAWLP